MGLRELSLFTGIGGGLLGSLILGWEPVQFVERDEYCRRLLDARFPSVPLHEDVRTFHPEPGGADIVTGGFPCQPFSRAGSRRGHLDERNMWPDTLRVLVESGAPLGFFENVPGLLGFDYFGEILGGLADAGFDAEWCVLGADDVGAPHRRKRLWILVQRPQAVADGELRGRVLESLGRLATADAGIDALGDAGAEGDGLHGDVDDAHRRRCEGRWVAQHADEQGAYGILAHRSSAGRWWPWAQDPADDPDAQSRLDRVAPRLPETMDRLRGLGNAQCPQCMAAAFLYLAREAGVLDA